MIKVRPRLKRYCMPDSSLVLTDEILLREIDPGSRVIDLGCADGRLASTLMERHGCEVLGVELDDDEFLAAVDRGIAVIQADLDHGLQDVPSDSFDFAVLSQTLQQVRHPLELLDELLRVAKRALVVVPNFGYWKVRLQVALTGRAPITEELPYQWYNTPNLHFMSLHDFRDLESRGNFRIVKELPIIADKSVEKAWLSNLRAKTLLFVLERGEHKS